MNYISLKYNPFGALTDISTTGMDSCKITFLFDSLTFRENLSISS